MRRFLSLTALLAAATPALRSTGRMLVVSFMVANLTQDMRPVYPLRPRRPEQPQRIFVAAPRTTA